MIVLGGERLPSSGVCRVVQIVDRRSDAVVCRIERQRASIALPCPVELAGGTKGLAQAVMDIGRVWKPFRVPPERRQGSVGVEDVHGVVADTVDGRFEATRRNRCRDGRHGLVPPAGRQPPVEGFLLLLALSGSARHDAIGDEGGQAMPVERGAPAVVQIDHGRAVVGVGVPEEMPPDETYIAAMADDCHIVMSVIFPAMGVPCGIAGGHREGRPGLAQRGKGHERPPKQRL